MARRCPHEGQRPRLRQENGRIVGRYGRTPANWIDLGSPIEIKSAIDNPRHQEDARVLLEVKRLREQRGA